MTEKVQSSSPVHQEEEGKAKPKKEKTDQAVDGDEARIKKKKKKKKKPLDGDEKPKSLKKKKKKKKADAKLGGSESNDDSTSSIILDMAAETVEDPADAVDKLLGEAQQAPARPKKKKKTKKVAEEGGAEREKKASDDALNETLDGHNTPIRKKKKKKEKKKVAEQRGVEHDMASDDATNETLDGHNTPNRKKKKKKNEKKVAGVEHDRASDDATNETLDDHNTPSRKKKKKKKISPTNSPVPKKKRSLKKHKKANHVESLTKGHRMARELPIHGSSVKEKTADTNLFENKVETDSTLAFASAKSAYVFEIQPSNFILESEKALASRPARKPRKKTRLDVSETTAASPTHEASSPNPNYYFGFTGGLRSGIRSGLPAGLPAGI